jgi:hypothetical protein
LATSDTWGTPKRSSGLPCMATIPTPDTPDVPEPPTPPKPPIPPEPGPPLPGPEIEPPDRRKNQPIIEPEKDEAEQR